MSISGIYCHLASSVHINSTHPDLEIKLCQQYRRICNTLPWCLCVHFDPPKQKSLFPMSAPYYWIRFFRDFGSCTILEATGRISQFQLVQLLLGLLKPGWYWLRCIPVYNFGTVPGASSVSTLGGTGICPKYWQCLMICLTEVHQYFPRSLFTFFYLKQSGDRGLQEHHCLYMNKNKQNGAMFWFSSTGCRILWVFPAFPPGELTPKNLLCPFPIFSHWFPEELGFPIAFSLNSPLLKSIEERHGVSWIVQWSIVFTRFPRDDYGPWSNSYQSASTKR